MKAVVYKGPNKVATETVDDPKIEKPTDVLVKVTTTNLCGSDLHLYEGRAGFEEGRILGHENQGEVVEVGNAVVQVRVGYAMLSDVLPTGWHGTRLAGLQPGESIVIYGAGPVGLMAALAAWTQGASKVMVVDQHPDRLKLAEEFGAIPIDFTDGDPAEQVADMTDGLGADRGVEAVGYQACGIEREEVPNKTMNDLVRSVRFTGGIGVVGVFVPEDPGAATELAKEGKIAFDIGTFFMRGQQIGSGQASVKMYNRRLAALIHAGRIEPSKIVSHELSLDEAADAYKHFGDRDRGWTKVLFKPAA